MKQPTVQAALAKAKAREPKPATVDLLQDPSPGALDDGDGEDNDERSSEDRQEEGEEEGQEIPDELLDELEQEIEREEKDERRGDENKKTVRRALSYQPEATEPATPSPHASLPEVVNSSTRNAEWKRLDRAMRSARLTKCPQMKEVWQSGTLEDRNALLKKWIEAGENNDALEAALVATVSRSRADKEQEEQLTVEEMRKKCVPEQLGFTSCSAALGACAS